MYAEAFCLSVAFLNFSRKVSVVSNVSQRLFLHQKGGVPAAPSGTATLLRLSPNYLFHP